MEYHPLLAIQVQTLIDSYLSVESMAAKMENLNQSLLRMLL